MTLMQRVDAWNAEGERIWQAVRQEWPVGSPVEWYSGGRVWSGVVEGHAGHDVRSGRFRVRRPTGSVVWIGCHRVVFCREGTQG